MTTDVVRRNLDDLTFSIVGPGRVGASLTYWLEAAGAERGSIVSRGRTDSVLGSRRLPVASCRSEGDDLLLIAVPDPALSGVVRELAETPQARVVLHTSGSQGSEVLEPLRERGSAGGSFHPLRAFPTVLSDPSTARRTFFALDGDPPAIELGRRIAAAWGSPNGIVPGDQRALYHLAATLAAGGVATLVETAGRIAAAAGVPETARGAYRQLAIGAIEALGESGGSAITGPVARGDLEIVERLSLLARTAPQAHPLAVLLALETLNQVAEPTRGSGAHPQLRRALLEICRREDFLKPVLEGVERDCDP